MQRYKRMKVDIPTENEKKMESNGLFDGVVPDKAMLEAISDHLQSCETKLNDCDVKRKEKN